MNQKIVFTQPIIRHSSDDKNSLKCETHNATKLKWEAKNCGNKIPKYRNN